MHGVINQDNLGIFMLSSAGFGILNFKTLKKSKFIFPPLFKQFFSKEYLLENPFANIYCIDLNTYLIGFIDEGTFKMYVFNSEKDSTTLIFGMNDIHKAYFNTYNKKNKEILFSLVRKD